MIGFPCAKINLGLHIGAKRKDEYHEIESLLYPLPCYDVLEIVPARQLQLKVTGLPLSLGQKNAPAPPKNLVLQAYELLAAHYTLSPVRIHLHKDIPAGAGLGGGSSDAAQMLLLLNQQFSLGLKTKALQAYACKLGSDVPFFISSEPQLAQARGDQLTPSSALLEGLYVRVLVPRLRMRTAAAYAALGPRKPRSPLSQLLKKPRSLWKKQLKNDFEPWLLGLHPELKALKQNLEAAGAWYTSLSGSGTAIYGLFDTAPKTAPPKGMWCFTSIL